MMNKKESGNSDIAQMIKNQLHGINMFDVEQNCVQKAEDYDGHPYEYEVQFCVFVNSFLVAEIYDVDEDDNLVGIATKAYMNAVFAKNKPFFLFFHYRDEWKGISLYTKSNEKPEPDVYTNNYGKTLIDSTKIPLECCVDVEKKLWDVCFDEIAQMITKQSSNYGVTQALLEGFRERMKDIATKANTSEALKTRLEEFLANLKSDDNTFEIGEMDFYLEKEFEDNLFKALLGETKETLFRRFTSLNSLVALLQHCSHRMWSIASMNDRTECYYANQYIKGVQGDVEKKDNIEGNIEAYFNCYITCWMN